VTSWNGVFAPKGTPKEAVETMRKAMQEVLAMPDVVAQFAKLGVEAHSSDAAELEKRLNDDIKKWVAVIDKAGIPKK
jgi:tripartite-type tricarboxylate transporter receptor subunit TctC